VQHVGRVDRQQRRGAAEQHREQVERDRPEHEPPRTHEAQARQQGLPAGRLGGARRVDAAATNAEHHRDGDREQYRDARVDRRRAEQVDEAAERRARDRCDLPRRRVERHGGAELLARDQIRQQRLASRHRKGARHAEQHHDREDRASGTEAAQRKPEQQQRAQALERETRGQDAPAVAAVGHVAGRQDQQHEGQELRQPDQPEVERIARGLVDLPADGHRLHLHGQRRQEARAQEKGEVTIAQYGAARVGRCVHAAAQRVIGSIGRGRIARSCPAPTPWRRRCDHCPEALACC